MTKQTAEILLEWLKSQRRIEDAKREGLANTTDSAVYWMKNAQWQAIDEIDRQIKELQTAMRLL
jgi:hypothetical protein